MRYYFIILLMLLCLDFKGSVYMKFNCHQPATETNAHELCSDHIMTFPNRQMRHYKLASKVSLHITMTEATNSI